MESTIDTHRLIWDYQKATVAIYKEKKLSCISGIDKSFTINGRQVVLWHADVTRRTWVKNNGQFNYHDNLDDLIHCSDEILYFTAQLYLYKPYINDPREDKIFTEQGTLYPNLLTIEGKRYNMFADIVCQVLYNYWDRIGDLLASFFPELIDVERVFFSSAMKVIPKQFHENKGYIWLHNFLSNEYLILNKIRRDVVHYSTINSQFSVAQRESVVDADAIEKLQTEREGWADFYAKHIELSLSGFEHALILLEEIDKTFF